jgi:hypothetical protein
MWPTSSNYRWELVYTMCSMSEAFYNRKHRQLDFVVGEWSWLHLLHRPIASLDVKGRGKLGSKFFRPFQVTEKIGNMAYAPTTGGSSFT